MSNIEDVIHVSRLYRDINEAIDKMWNRDQLFLKSWIGLVDYKDGKWIVDIAGYRGKEVYKRYQDYVLTYDDDFLSCIWIHAPRRPHVLDYIH